MAPRTVFYAWQAQRPGTCNRYLIEEALERALKDPASDKEEPLAFELDQDARGEPGAAEISAAILRKIDECAIFVADVTPVGTLINGKVTPNPNVLFELGYAWHKLGPGRIILVLNDAFGTPEELPFDISKRSLVRYRRDSDDADGPASVRAILAGRLRSVISVMARDDQLRPLREQGLSATDIALFRDVYAKMLEADRDFCSYEIVLQVGSNLSLNASEVIGATQMLADLGLWHASVIIGPTRFSGVAATTEGMEEYCRAFLPGYRVLTTDIQRRIVDGVTHSSELAAAVEKPKILVLHVLERLEEDQYIRTATDSGGTEVFDVKLKLRRLFGQS